MAGSPTWGIATGHRRRTVRSVLISPVRRAVLGAGAALMIMAGCGSSGPKAPAAVSAPLPAETIAITSVATTSPATTVAMTAPTPEAPAVTPDATSPPASVPPELDPQVGVLHPVETTEPAPSPVDLAAIDWANRNYLLPCPTLEPLTEVALVDGEHRATMGYKLWNVQYGELGDQRRPVAVLTIACFGANAFPPSVLVYGDGPEPELLGYAAWNDSWRYDDRYHSWKVADVAIADGVLVLQGRGYGPGSAGCCPNLSVRVVVGVTGDGTLYEISHTEEPYSPS